MGRAHGTSEEQVDRLWQPCEVAGLLKGEDASAWGASRDLGYRRWWCMGTLLGRGGIAGECREGCTLQGRVRKNTQEQQARTGAASGHKALVESTDTARENRYRWRWCMGTPLDEGRVVSESRKQRAYVREKSKGRGQALRRGVSGGGRVPTKHEKEVQRHAGGQMWGQKAMREDTPGRRVQTGAASLS